MFFGKSNPGCESIYMERVQRDSLERFLNRPQNHDSQRQDISRTSSSLHTTVTGDLKFGIE